MKRTFSKERCEILGEYLVENNVTIRAAAAHFGISKSTVHKDLAWRLKKVNPALFSDVKNIIEKNKSERHIRGGEATRKKYLYIEKNKKKYSEFIR